MIIGRTNNWADMPYPKVVGIATRDSEDVASFVDVVEIQAAGRGECVSLGDLWNEF